MKRLKWLWGPLRSVDWFIAWFGGSAVTAFQLHRPDLGWIYAALAVACAAGGILGAAFARKKAQS